MALVMSPENLMPPSAISGTPAAARGLGAFGDRGDLRHARAADHARGADGARPDADLDAVHAQRDQVARAFVGRHVAGDQLHVRAARCFTRCDRVHHALAVAVRGIDRQHVHFSAHQFLRALQEIARRAERRAHAQAALRVLGGVRIFQLLLNVLDRDQALQVVVIVHHQQLFHAMRVQDRFGFFERGAHAPR